MTTDDRSALEEHYELGELIGRGGMADVHRATDRRLGRTVAIKVLRDRATGEEDKARFTAEGRTLASLNHPSLVTLYDAGLDDNHPYLVMEYVDGKPLSAHLRDGRPLAEEPLARIGQQIAEGLAFAHERGIVHRDVKPGNILLTPDRRAKLADFGIARLVDRASSLTLTGHTIGTPAYLAPEQVAGREVTGATDVYALGLVLIEALSGRRPFDGTSAEAAVARLHADPTIPDGIGPGWRRVLSRMTARDAEDRPTAAEAARLLDGLTRGEAPDDTALMPQPMARTTAAAAPEPEPAPTPTSEQAFPASRSRRRLVPVAVAVLIAAVALTVLALALTTGDDEQPASPERPEVPSDVPAELEGPLTDLHDSIYGSDQ